MWCFQKVNFNHLFDVWILEFGGVYMLEFIWDLVFQFSCTLVTAAPLHLLLHLLSKSFVLQSEYYLLKIVSLILTSFCLYAIVWKIYPKSFFNLGIAWVLEKICCELAFFSHLWPLAGTVYSWVAFSSDLIIWKEDWQLYQCLIWWL